MAASVNKIMGPLEWLLLVALAVIWSGAFFFNKIALHELPPFTVVLGRVVIAAMALHLFMVMTGRRVSYSPKLWGWFLVMGALNNVIPFSLIVWGQTQIASSLASILNATTPLWTVLLAHVFTRDERLAFNRLCGVILGLVGVVIIIGPDTIKGIGSNAAAQTAVVGGALFYALAGIWGKRFRDISPYATASGQLTCSALLMIPIALIVDRPWNLPLPDMKSWVSIIMLALLCTAIAYVIYFRILSTAGATNLLLVTFLMPIGALLLGVFILGERPEPRHFAGMAVIGLGLASIDDRLKRRMVNRWRKSSPGPAQSLQTQSEQGFGKSGLEEREAVQ